MHKRLTILAIAVAVSYAMPLSAGTADTNAVKGAETAVSAPKPRSRPVRRDADKIEAVVPSTTVVENVEPVPEVKPTTPPSIAAVLAVELAKATSAQVPDIFAAAIAKASEAEIPQILALLEARMSSMEVKDVERVFEVALRDKWYDRFGAESGSLLFWILRIAKEKAQKGENVDDLEKRFRIALQGWVKEAD